MDHEDDGMFSDDDHAEIDFTETEIPLANYDGPDQSTNESDDFFGDDNFDFRNTTIESPYEIPKANYRDLGRPKDPRPPTTKQQVKTTEVEIGLLPHRSDSERDDEEEDDEIDSDERDQNKSKIIPEKTNATMDFMAAFRDRQKQADKPTEKSKLDIEEVAVENKIFKYAETEYQERVQKYQKPNVLNGIVEQDEIEEQLGFLELIDKDAQKKERGLIKSKKEVEDKNYRNKYSEDRKTITAPIGLTSHKEQMARLKDRELEANVPVATILKIEIRNNKGSRRIKERL